MNSLLTIAIPVFNRTAFFRQALESALNQTVPVKVLVVDNASDEGDFAAILEDYPAERISFLRNEKNLGMVGNWNRCIELCITPYLLILHDDDFLERDHVEMFLKVHQPGVALYYCNAAVVDRDGVCVDYTFHLPLSAYRETWTWCVTSPVFAGAIFDVATARRLGGFSRRLRYTVDWDFWFQLFLSGPVRLVPGQGASYRAYESAERATTQLAGGAKTIRFNRTQVRRNFVHLRSWGLYRMLRRNGLIPRPHLRVLLGALDGLKGRERRYWAVMCAMGPRETVAQTVMCWLFRMLGPVMFVILRWVSRFFGASRS